MLLLKTQEEKEKQRRRKRKINSRGRKVRKEEGRVGEGGVGKRSGKEQKGEG